MITTFFHQCKNCIFLFIITLLACSPVGAAQLDFSWLPNSEYDSAVGYKIHYGVIRGVYTESVDVGAPAIVNGRMNATVSGLAENQAYYFVVTAYNIDGYEGSYSAVIQYPVNTGSYELFFSSSTNLSNSVSLDGATVDGDIYVFTGPDTNVSRVTFSVDGVFKRAESHAPYELAGGSAFDTSQLSPGRHEITADVELTDGSQELISAVFIIPSISSIPPTSSSVGLFVSNSPDLSAAVALDGATVDGNIYVFTGPDLDVSRVTFSVDSVFERTESHAPFELAGSAAFDTSPLSLGQHEIKADVEFSDGRQELISAIFTIPSGDSTSSGGSSQDATIGNPDPSLPSQLAVEVGEVNITHSWARVSFASTYNKPVVVAKVMTYNGRDPVIVRMRNVGPSGFSVRLQEMDSDDRHPRETVSYFVMEAGTYTLDDGTRLEAGTFKSAGSGSFKSKNFKQNYAVAPVVMTAIASYNESDPVTGRIKNIGKSGFAYTMQEKEASRNRRHATEVISYIAWEPSTGTVGGIKYSVGTTGRRVNHRFSWNAYDTGAVAFQQVPVVIVDMQTTNGFDTAGLRCKDNSRTGLRIMVEEERSKDDEIGHASENVGYFAISR